MESFSCSPLSLYDAVKLLGLLADKIHLTTSSFINIRYRRARRGIQHPPVPARNNASLCFQRGGSGADLSRAPERAQHDGGEGGC